MKTSPISLFWIQVFLQEQKAEELPNTMGKGFISNQDKGI